MSFDKLDDCNRNYKTLGKNLDFQIKNNEVLKRKIENLESENYQLIKKLQRTAVNIVTPESSADSHSTRKSFDNEIHFSKIPPRPVRRSMMSLSHSSNDSFSEPTIPSPVRTSSKSLHKRGGLHKYKSKRAKRRYRKTLKRHK